MSERSDVVAIGGGTNTLIAAAYLAKGGLSVTVLEEREIAGGGVVTEELTLPGFRHDTASSFHVDLQFNPLIAADELGLMADHGLRYVRPDPAMVVHCANAETVTAHGSAEATAEEIARYSPADAREYRELINTWEEVIGPFTRRLAGPPGTVADSSAEAAAKLAELASLSGARLVTERFEDERTRALLLAPAAVGDLNPPGTGFLPVNFAGMLSRVSWTHSVGGSDALAKALVSLIEAHGGRVLCGRLVNRIAVEGGRAAAALTADGERFDADRAIVSGAHVTQLPAMLGPGHLPQEFEGKLARWRPGSSVFVVHLAISRLPEYQTATGRRPAVVGAFGTPAGITAQRGDVEEGRLSGPERWMLAVCSSVADPSRAPEGKATLKLVTAAPYAVDGTPDNWDGERERYADELVKAFTANVTGFDEGDQLARTIHTPVDIQRLNRHNVAGGFQGGEMSPDQVGPHRPVTGWSAYRMPVAGLYQTGGSTFPGGGVSGWPGRNAARAVLDDLGIDSGDFMRQAGEPDTLPAPSPG